MILRYGVYELYHPGSNPLAARVQQGLLHLQSSICLGSTKTVFLDDVVITSMATNACQTASFTIDTSSLEFPKNGINHIRITNSHLPLDAYGKMYVGFDNFCLIN